MRLRTANTRRARKLRAHERRWYVFWNNLVITKRKNIFYLALRTPKGPIIKTCGFEYAPPAGFVPFSADLYKPDGELIASYVTPEDSPVAHRAGANFTIEFGGQANA